MLVMGKMEEILKKINMGRASPQIGLPEPVLPPKVDPDEGEDDDDKSLFSAFTSSSTLASQSLKKDLQRPCLLALHAHTKGTRRRQLKGGRKSRQTDHPTHTLASDTQHDRAHTRHNTHTNV
jgi:hypothetical protein